MKAGGHFLQNCNTIISFCGGIRRLFCDYLKTRDSTAPALRLIHFPKSSRQYCLENKQAQQREFFWPETNL
jgi:hypothetical protein